MTAITIGYADTLEGPGDKIHMVRTAAGRTCCSFNVYVRPKDQRPGTPVDITCAICKKLVAGKLKKNDFLHPSVLVSLSGV